MLKNQLAVCIEGKQKNVGDCFVKIMKKCKLKLSKGTKTNNKYQYNKYRHTNRDNCFIAV